MNPYYPNQAGSFYQPNQQYPNSQQQYPQQPMGAQAGPFYGQGQQQGPWGAPTQQGYYPNQQPQYYPSSQPQQQAWGNQGQNVPFYPHSGAGSPYAGSNSNWQGAPGVFAPNASGPFNHVQQVFAQPPGLNNFATTFPQQIPTFAALSSPHAGGQPWNLPSVPPPGYPPSAQYYTAPSFSAPYPDTPLQNYTAAPQHAAPVVPSHQNPPPAPASSGSNIPRHTQFQPETASPVVVSQYQSVSQFPRPSSEQQTSFGQIPTSISQAPVANQKKEVDRVQLDNDFYRSAECNASGMDTLIAEITTKQGDMKEGYLKELLEYWEHEKQSIQYKKLAKELGIEEEIKETSLSKTRTTANFDKIAKESSNEDKVDDTMLMHLPHDEFKAYIENQTLYGPERDSIRDSIIQARVGMHENMNISEFSDLYACARSHSTAVNIIQKYLQKKDNKTLILENILKVMGGYDLTIQEQLLKLASEEDNKNNLYGAKSKEFAYLKRFVDHPNCQAEDYRHNMTSDLKSYIIAEGLENWSPEKNEKFLPILGLNDEASQSRYVTKPRELLAAADAARTQAEAVIKNIEAYKKDPAYTSICKGLLEKLEGLTKDSTTINSITTCLQTIKNLLNKRYEDNDLSLLKHGANLSRTKEKASLQKELGHDVFRRDKYLLAQLNNQYESISDYEKNTMKDFMKKYNDTVIELINKNFNHKSIKNFLI